MAIRLQFLSLIVPRAKFIRCRGLPPFFQQLRPEAGFFIETNWYDAHLWCETGMDGYCVDEMIDQWQEWGLVPKDASGQWQDLCLCASARGPLGSSCPWLRFDSEKNAVWLDGAEPGDVVGGSEQRGEIESALARHEAAGELAYVAMSEARRPKDDYQIACTQLALALDAARFLNHSEDSDRLLSRLAHIKAVYDHQMRGF